MDELIQTARNCRDAGIEHSVYDCHDCPYYEYEDCAGELLIALADALERTQDSGIINIWERETRELRALNNRLKNLLAANNIDWRQEDE